MCLYLFIWGPTKLRLARLTEREPSIYLNFVFEKTKMIAHFKFCHFFFFRSYVFYKFGHWVKNLVLWFSIYSVVWIRSSEPVRFISQKPFLTYNFSFEMARKWSLNCLVWILRYSFMSGMVIDYGYALWDEANLARRGLIPANTRA